MEILVENLTKIYAGKVRALNGIDLNIPGGMFGLLGPNGAGKSTLMRTLAGILRPTSGKVQVGHFNIADSEGRTAIKNILGYLPQELGLYPDLTARQFLEYIAVLKGMDARLDRRKRVDELLELVNLEAEASRKLKTFSGGMKRRVGIAQALINQPKLLIVDEPTAGLDPEERIRFRNLLAELAGEMTVILSTHIVEDIAQTCRNLAVMKQGQVVFQGTTLDLIEAARNKVWTISNISDGNTINPKPPNYLTVVSTISLGNRIQYRVVGEPTVASNTVPAEPNLEDGYVWLMHSSVQIGATL